MRKPNMSSFSVIIIITAITFRLVNTSLAKHPSSSSSSSPKRLNSSSQNMQSLKSSGDEWMRVKRSIGEKQTGPSFKSLCEDHCQCAQQNSSFPSRRRQQKAQHDSLALTSRSLVLTELQSSVQCKSGVSKVMDGCGCCLVCARQQGDSCDKIHPCDALKQLFCDTIVSSQNGLIIESGICKPKSGEPCVIDGKKYEDGKQFQLNCSLSCSCQNGQYACASLCPQEERPPSSEHCGQAKLLSIAGRCCKEWVCPHPPQHMNVGLQSSSYGYPLLIEPDANRRERCIKDVSQWSSCSATCGTGWSIHMTNDNENCKTVVERKMCYMRPCPPDEAQINPNASQTRNQCHEDRDMVTLSIEGCVSEKEVGTTICNNCFPTPSKTTRHQTTKSNSATKRKCCKPGKMKTIEVLMKCKNGTSTEMKFWQVKGCKCKESFCKD